MRHIQNWHRAGLRSIRQAVKTNHGRIVLAGLFVGLCYFPIWLIDLTVRSVSGSTGLVLIAGVLGLAFSDLWRRRQQLFHLRASEEDRFLGHILILSGIVIFPFCRFALWSQAIVWLLVLVGIAFSSWGVDFFNQYRLVTLLMPLSVYPRPGITARLVWETVTPPKLLENFMAWGGSWGLKAIGQAATVEGGRFIKMPGGAVEVAWGCNGFNMAFAMAVTGLLMGLFFKRNARQIALLVSAGIVVALLFNIPRIVLISLAAVYWGKYWFNFWHGSWGAQIFVGVLFTIYYYVAMSLLSRRPAKLSAGR